MRSVLRFILVFTILLAGCHSDIYTKKLATASLKDKSKISLVSGYLDLRYTENTAIAFSMLKSLGDDIRKPLIIVLQGTGTLVLCGILFMLRRRSFFTLFPFVLILSGALGNLIDRLRLGYVVDFIHFRIQDHFSWPIFNLADVWITVGLGILILQILMNKDPFKQPAVAS